MRLRSNKMAIGENLLYFLVWTVAILVPILNAKMMSEEHVYFVNILTAWLKILPYGIIFLLNNLIFAPKLLLRKHYAAYYLVSILYLVALFYSIEYYETTMRHSPFADSDLYIVHGRASFTDLAWYWNVLLGLFLQNTNNGIKIMFKSMSDEQKMVSLERQSLQAEMDYLKYQINPHFFMNTLNNIHALIDIDTEAAKETVIELSKMMRYVLYDSENAETSHPQRHTLRGELHRAHAHTLYGRCGHTSRRGGDCPSRGQDSAAAAHRLRGERLQARRKLQQPLVRTHRHQLRRQYGLMHRHQLAPRPHGRP